MPLSPAFESEMRKIAQEIKRNGGGVTILVAHAATPEEHRGLLARFNRAREQEFGEVAQECKKFLAHIQREAAEREYDFSELEELEEDLVKVERWFAQIKERDVFGVQAGAGVGELLEGCHKALAAFGEEVFQRGVREEEL